jgi:hypothetical protein
VGHRARVRFIAGLALRHRNARQVGLEANHTPSSRTEVKNAWIHTSSSSYVYMVLCLVKLTKPVIRKSKNFEGEKFLLVGIESRSFEPVHLCVDAASRARSQAESVT